MRTFDHVGLTAHEKHPGERFVEKTRVWVTDPHEHPYAVEYLRYEADSPVCEKLRTTPHIAFHVDDIASERAGLTALIEPFSSVAGHVVGFFEAKDGTIVELMQY